MVSYHSCMSVPRAKIPPRTCILCGNLFQRERDEGSGHYRVRTKCYSCVPRMKRSRRIDTKICRCGKTFYRPPNLAGSGWKHRRHCSAECANKSRSEWKTIGRATAYSDVEREIIIRLYPSYGKHVLGMLLPGRGKDAIRRFAASSGIRLNPDVCRENRRRGAIAKARGEAVSILPGELEEARWYAEKIRKSMKKRILCPTEDIPPVHEMELAIARIREEKEAAFRSLKSWDDNFERPVQHSSF